jgi:PBSX family phage portal protein
MSLDEADGPGVHVFGGDDPDRGAWQAIQQAEFTDRETEKAVTSQQHDTDDPHTRPSWYEPPYLPKHLALLKERSETHARCVDAKAQGVAGHGFDVVPHPNAVNEDSETEPPGRDTVRDFWFGSDSTFELGPDRQPATAAEVLEQAWDDYESIGWGVVEVLINDNTAAPTGLAHVPAHTIRVRIDEPGYVQIDPDADQIEGYYAPSGARYGDDQTFVDTDEGTVANSIAGVETPANELLVVRNYSALAPHYGTPDVIPALETIAGDVAARSYNRRFFENDGVPRFAVIVEGGELSERARTELEEKSKALREPDGAHQGVLLEAIKATKSSFEDVHDVSLRIEPLTVDVQEDASFVEYRKENEHSILSAHAVPPVVVNRTEQINFANAKAQRRRFAKETIQPKQEKFAERLYRTIHQTMHGVDGWTLDFTLVGGEDEQRQAEIDKLRIEGTAGVLTVDEAREQVGLDPLGGPEGNLLVAELSQTGPAGGSGGPSAGGGEGGDVQSARRDQRAADLGYSVVDRANRDD